MTFPTYLIISGPYFRYGHLLITLFTEYDILCSLNREFIQLTMHTPFF